MTVPNLRSALMILCQASESDLKVLFQGSIEDAGLQKVFRAYQSASKVGVVATSQPDEAGKHDLRWHSDFAKILGEARDFLKMNPLAAIGSSMCDGDPRIVDIKRKFNSRDSIRRCCGSRSLAESFVQYRKSISKPLNLTVDGVSGRVQHISDFIKSNDFDNTGECTRSAINSGLQILVIGERFPHHPRLHLLMSLASKNWNTETFKCIVSTFDTQSGSMAPSPEYAAIFKFVNEPDDWMETVFASYDQQYRAICETRTPQQGTFPAREPTIPTSTHAALPPNGRKRVDRSHGPSKKRRLTQQLVQAVPTTATNAASAPSHSAAQSDDYTQQEQTHATIALEIGGVRSGARDRRGRPDQFQRRSRRNSFDDRSNARSCRNLTEPGIADYRAENPDADKQMPQSDTLIHQNRDGVETDLSMRMADKLATFLYHLSPQGLPASLLECATRPQTRWSARGERFSMTSRDFYTSDDFLAIFTDPATLQETIRICLKHQKIVRCSDNGDIFYGRTGETASASVADSDHVWLLRVAQFVAFVSPRREPTSSSTSPEVDPVQPIVEAVYQHLQKRHCGLPPELSNHILEAFLSANGIFSQAEVLRDLDRFVGPTTPAHLRLLLLLRRSFSLRSQGLYLESRKLLQDTSDSWEDPQNNYEWYLRGRLLLSRAENAINRGELPQALESIGLCGETTGSGVITDKPMQIQLQRMLATVSGRVWRYMGKFGDARDCLVIASQAPEMALPGSINKRCHILHHLSDVYCELGQPMAAQAVLEPVLTEMREAKSTDSTAYRRLLASSVEIRIRSAEYTTARAALSSLTKLFESMHVVSPADQIGHVFCEFKNALVEYVDHQNGDTGLEAAYEHLLTAKQLINRYRTFTPGGFYSSLVDLFLAVVSHNLGRNIGAGWLHTALGCNPRHYIVGLGTYDYTFIQNEFKQIPQK